MKKKSCAITLIIISLLLIFGAASVPAAPSGGQEESRVVTVGFAEIPGISQKGKDGRRTGLLMDYLHEIGQYNNWDYRYIDVGAEELVDGFINGDYDLMGGTFYSSEFEKYFAYPKYSMGTGRATLFCRNNDKSIKSYELSTLNGKTIGVYERAADKVRRLKDFLELNKLDCGLSTIRLRI